MATIGASLVKELREKTGAQALKEAETAVGAPVTVAGFVRYALGEGVERPAGEP